MSGRGPRLISVKRGTPIGSLDVGSTIKLNVNGTAREFLVVHQGLPSSLYDASCDGTWLLMKDCYENRAWSSNNNDYKNSTINTYLNGTILNMFDSDIREAVKEVKIPYRAGSGYSTTVTSGANGLPTKVFLLSFTELGYNFSTMPKNEGATLSYFTGCAENGADAKRIANLSGSATAWWSRSPSCSSANGDIGVLDIISNGYYAHRVYSSEYGIRPAFILPSSFNLTEEMLTA